MLLLSLALLGLAARPAGAKLPGGPRVVLEGLGGRAEEHSLEGLDTDDPRRLGAQVVRFEGFPAPERSASTDAVRVELHGPEILIGELARVSDETLAIALAKDLQVGASLERIRAITCLARIPPGWNAPLERAAEGDRVYRKKNDTLERIDGGVEAFGEKGFRFHDERIGSLEVAWSELVALFVDSSGGKPAADPAGRVPVVVDAHRGSRLRGLLVKLDPGGVLLERAGGETVKLPLRLVSELLVDDGRVVYLSDLAPASAPPSQPFGDDLGMRWPHRIDRSVMDAPLVVGGVSYARGIGVHAPSRVVWALDGGFESLRGAVAVDDSALGLPVHGSVRFRVLVDGKKRFESPILRGGDAPHPIVLEPKSLAGAKELVLEVDTAGDDFVADRADWLRVQLVRGAGGGAEAK